MGSDAKPDPMAGVHTSGAADAHLDPASMYDVAGRLVRQIAEGSFEGGVHTLTWDGTSSGSEP